MVKVAIYLRFGNEPDREKQKGIINQYLNNNFKKDDYKVIGAYIDDGYSGNDYNRPQLRNLLKDAEMGKFNTIVVEHLGKLSRDTTETLYMLDYLNSKDIKLYDCMGTDIIDSHSNMRKTLENFYNKKVTINSKRKYKDRYKEEQKKRHQRKQKNAYREL